MQEKDYKGQIKDVDELCLCILVAWDELDQQVIGFSSQTVVNASSCMC